MKTRSTLAIFFLVLLQYGCDKCKGYACSLAPPSLSIDLIDQTTEINVFASEKYNPAEIRLIDQNNKEVNYTYMADKHLIFINLTADDSTFQLKLRNQVSVPIHAIVVIKGSKCCKNRTLDQLSINNVTYNPPFEPIVKVKI